jgi:hypothetical protein
MHQGESAGSGARAEGEETERCFAKLIEQIKTM